MFKLIATLVVLVNGQPGNETAGSMTYNKRTFATEQECKDFALSDDGRSVLMPIAQMAGQRGLAVGVSCAKQEDNTI